jgi:hypothetical protein
VILPIAYGFAIAATLLLIRHLARRYPSVPARVPLHIGYDGRLWKRWGPKAALWLAPGILVALLIVLGGALLLDPPKPGDPENVRLVVTLVLVTIAEIAWFMAWVIDRQIELARKMTYRIAPARMWGATVPLIATIVTLIVVAVRH